VFIAEGAHRAIDACIAGAGKISLFDILGLPDWVAQPGRMTSNGTMRDMKRVANNGVEARRARGPKGIPDLLTFCSRAMILKPNAGLIPPSCAATC
jgi:hypothetical protein